MMALLHTGYEMPLSREVKIAKKIKNNELGWCLGARLVNPNSYFPAYTDLHFPQLAPPGQGIWLDLPHQGGVLNKPMASRKIIFF